MNDYGSFIEAVLSKKRRREADRERQLKEVKDRALRNAAIFEEFARGEIIPTFMSARDGLRANGLEADVKSTSAMLALLDEEILTEVELSFTVDSELTARHARFRICYAHGSVRVLQTISGHTKQTDHSLDEFADKTRLESDIKSFIQSAIEN